MPDLHELYFHDVRLKHLHLQNFRGFGHVALDFHPDKPVTVLIADNGGGKSTILDAVAEFLKRFFCLAIAGKSEGDQYETRLGEKDIFNERNNAGASAVLHISHSYPHKELFRWMDKCAQYLDENHVEGKAALIGLEDDVWVLQIWRNEAYITYYLPDEFQTDLDRLVQQEKVLSAEDIFKVCSFDKDGWRPNIWLSAQEVTMHIAKSGAVSLGFELTRGNPSPLEYKSLTPKPDTYSGLAKAWEAGQTFISDYATSTSGYNRHNPLNESTVVLPLLAYYGGAAINAKHDNELKVPYRSGEFQAYAQALEPERFDFEEFLTWALWASEKQQHAWRRVKATILDVLNADPNCYTDIQVETQKLLFYKKAGQEIAPIPVQAAQLSAGEQNMMALVGDLAKRAVQLNAVLFNTDVDSNADASALSPLQYTPGIVLIDEIDLHLHPRWQRVIIPKLREHFPRVQFVVTTHSPFVMQSIEIGNIVTLPQMEQSTSLSGWEIYEIIQDKMAEEGSSMSDKYQKEMQKFNQAILYDNQNDLEDSYQWLIKHLHPDNPKKSAIEMQYNVFSKKGEYNEKT